MTKRNFNSLKNIKAPERLIDRALEIPSKKAVKIRRIRVISAAACLAAVCLTSLSLFLVTKNGGAIQSGEPSFSSYTLAPEKDTRNNNSNKEKQTTVSDTVQSNSASERSTVVPSSAAVAAASSTGSLSAEPRESQPRTQSQTQPSDKTAQTAPEPSENSLPTNAAATSVTSEPDETTAPAIEVICRAEFEGSTSFTLGSKVYCVIADSNGNALGDPDCYSDEHLAIVKQIEDNRFAAEYYPVYHNLALGRGVYTFTLFDEFGNTLAEGVIFVP